MFRKGKKMSNTLLLSILGFIAILFFGVYLVYLWISRPVKKKKVKRLIKALELNPDKIYALKIDWSMIHDVDAAVEVINHAKDLGINFVILCNGLEIITEEK
jgi:hypothetical protein